MQMLPSFRKTVLSMPTSLMMCPLWRCAHSALARKTFASCSKVTALQDGKEDQALILVNGTICLSGVVQLSGEDCSLFSEAFVLCPASGQSGHHYIQHQVFKVHKQNAEELS